MLVLGIDSATYSGWAAIEDGDLRGYGGVGVDGIVDVATQWADADLAGVEDGFFGRSIATTKTLARITGRWEQSLYERGILVTYVYPASWQSAILGVAPKTHRALRKAAAQEWVRATYGVSAPEDEADAICLAAYVAGQAS